MEATLALSCPPRVTAAEPIAEDAVWLSALRVGEPWALERFYHAYQPQVFALCWRLTGRTEDAEDAMQGTFIRAFREVRRFRGDSSLKTWVYRIAVNEALGLLRKRRDAPELRDESVSMRDGAPALVEQLAVRNALARLNPQHRAILVLRFWEGLNGPEIAAVLRISVPAVKMRLHRAREEFRKWYQE